MYNVYRHTPLTCEWMPYHTVGRPVCSTVPGLAKIKENKSVNVAGSGNFDVLRMGVFIHISDRPFYSSF